MSDAPAKSLSATQQELVAGFELFDDWTDRYAYIIDLGRKLPPFPEAWQTEENRLHGCQSQVWLKSERQGDRLRFHAISDSAIVSGLIAILLKLYDNRTAKEILDTPPDFVAGIGLDKHLSMTRSNGLHAMLQAIRDTAAQTELASATEPLADEVIDLYDEQVMKLGADIPRTERLSDPDITVTEVSRVCGSQIEIDLKVDNDRVTDYAQTVDACQLGKVSAALMGRHVIGKTRDDIRSARDSMRRMLKEDGSAPNGDWAPFGIFVHARPFKSRHGSIMLPFEALVRAFDQLERDSQKNGSDTVRSSSP